MLNIMKADLYRIFRSKGFYITIILLLALIITIVAAGQLYIPAGFEQTQYTSEGAQISFSADAEKLENVSRGITIPFAMMGEPAMIVYFLLPFVIFICSADFSARTAKNVLSNGMPKIKFYLSKLILSCITCFCLFLSCVGVSTVLATIGYGFGGMFDMSFVGSVLRPFLAQLFMFISIVCVTVFLAFTTKKTAAVIGIYIALFLGQLFLFNILASLSDKLSPLLDYEIIAITSNLVNIDSMASGDIIRTFAVGGFYMLASTIGGIVIFNRSEVK